MRLYEIFILILGLILLLPVFGFSSTINVPGDSATIQAGIDAAVNGDTVLVANGTYTGGGNRDIDFLGKAIVVMSENGPEVTIIECEGTENDRHRGFVFQNNEDTTSVLQGFTIQNGYGPMDNSYFVSGAISVEICSPHINNCIFKNNTSDYGGAIYANASSTIIENCLFVSNMAAVEGGAIRYYSAIDTTNPTIKNCTFVNNSAGSAGSTIHSQWTNINLENSIFALNSSVQVIEGNNWLATLTCCDIYGNEEGDWIGIIADQNGVNGKISNDPLFCDTANSDYYFYDISPCASENNSCSTLIGAMGVNCNDIVPDITSLDSVAVFEDSLLLYHVTFNDDDGPETILTVENIPSWITFDTDSLYGIPIQGTADTSFTVIVSDGYKADTQEVYIDVVPNNQPPILDPIGTIMAYQGDTLILIISASDPNGDSLFLSAENLPDGASFTDSSNGTGVFYWIIGYDHEGMYSVTFNASDGELTDSELVTIQVNDTPAPQVLALYIDGTDSLQHIINHTPLIEWDYDDQRGRYPQIWFEIAVGTDDDWTYAEMWNPAPFESSDTFIVYDGSTLSDGETYYLRLRVSNSYQWSDWYETSFHMNSVPSAPVPLFPLDDDVTSNTPILWVENSFDAEGDVITYDFSGFHDTDCVAPNIDLQDVAEGTDSTGGQIIDPLGENCIYWWGARAFDGYEYSDGSAAQRFFIDGIPEPPTPFRVQYPPDTSGWYVFNMLSDFFWERSYGGDPFDSVYYTLEVAIDSNFNFDIEIDSIWQTGHTLTDSLEFGTQYWWKVKATDNTGLYTYSSNILDFKTWKLGDANGDWKVDIFDITFLISYLYKGGAAPYPQFMGDTNGDCLVNIFDVTYLITFLYKDGPAPNIGCE